jgi:hypothetical protein
VIAGLGLPHICCSTCVRDAYLPLGWLWAPCGSQRSLRRGPAQGSLWVSRGCPRFPVKAKHRATEPRCHTAANARIRHPPALREPRLDPPTSTNSLASPSPARLALSGSRWRLFWSLLCRKARNTCPPPPVILMSDGSCLLLRALFPNGTSDAST